METLSLYLRIHNRLSRKKKLDLACEYVIGANKRANQIKMLDMKILAFTEVNAMSDYICAKLDSRNPYYNMLYEMAEENSRNIEIYDHFLNYTGIGFRLTRHKIYDTPMDTLNDLFQEVSDFPDLDIYVEGFAMRINALVETFKSLRLIENCISSKLDASCCIRGKFELLSFIMDDIKDTILKIVQIQQDLSKKINKQMVCIDDIEPRRKNLILEGLKSTDTKCTICLEGFKSTYLDDLVVTKCDHHYHYDCIIRWQKQECPVCKQ